MDTSDERVCTEYGRKTDQDPRTPNAPFRNPPMGINQIHVTTSPHQFLPRQMARRRYISLPSWLRTKRESGEASGKEGQEPKTNRHTPSTQTQASGRSTRPPLYYAKTFTAWRKAPIDEVDGQKGIHKEIQWQYPNTQWSTEETPTSTSAGQERIKPSYHIKTPPIDIPIPTHWDDDQKLAYAIRKMSITPCATLV
jgi:hypothetical protein